MVCFVRDLYQVAPIHYVEYGEGKPVFNIHGWGPDQRMMIGAYEPVFEKTQGYRRIYPDLPGFGQTPVPAWLKDSDDMLGALCVFINTMIGRENFLLTGCSYGAYMALGLLHRMGERIDGVLLDVPMTSCKLTQGLIELPERMVTWQSPLLDELNDSPALQNYLGMAVTALPEGFEKFEQQIQPGLDARTLGMRSQGALGDYRVETEKAISGLRFDKPACILAGRQDHWTGYKMPYELLERFPRASFAVLDGAGHLLYIEKEPIFRQFVKDWLERVEMNLLTN